MTFHGLLLPRSTKKLLIPLIVSLLVLAMVACTQETPSVQGQRRKGHQIDGPFIEFYERLGGSNVLGPAISKPWSEGQRTLQYTEKALLVFDPLSPAPLRVRLYPLSTEMGFQDPPENKPENPAALYMNGHVVDPAFVPLYEQMGGPRTVGMPTTTIHYNPDLSRYEQYFETVAFYRLEGDAVGRAHLLSLGLYRCDEQCRSDPAGEQPLFDINGRVALDPSLQPPFKQAVESIGRDLTGFALDRPDLVNGRVELPMENLVLMINFDDVNTAWPAPIGRVLYQPHPPVPERQEPGFMFYEVANGLGYHVPEYFWDYLSGHGGIPVSGFPITELTSYSDQVRHQCFENLCLEYQDGVVRPLPIGYAYLTQWKTSEPLPEPLKQTEIPMEPEPEKQPEPEPTVPLPSRITMSVWVKNTILGSDEEQEVGVRVMGNGEALEGVQPTLIVTYPDGHQEATSMPLTFPDGISTQILPPMDAHNGQLILFDLCLERASGEMLCVQDEYLIWND